MPVELLNIPAAARQDKIVVRKKGGNSVTTERPIKKAELKFFKL